MSNIYEIAVKFTYDKYEYRIFRGYKFIEHRTIYMWRTPIYANNEKQAIEKFSIRYNVDECTPWVIDGKAENIQREVICTNKNIVYSIKELQNKMDSGDFLDYCRNKLGLNQTIDTILK